MNRQLNETRFSGVDVYRRPLCETFYMNVEGVLCSSYNSKIEQLEKENVLDW